MFPAMFQVTAISFNAGYSEDSSKFLKAKTGGRAVRPKPL